MLRVIEDTQIEIKVLLQRCNHARNQAIAAPADRLLDPADRNRAGKNAGAVRRAAFLIADKLKVLIGRLHMIRAFEGFPNVSCIQLAAKLIRHILNMGAEISLHLLRQFEALILLQHPRKAAFSALRVHPDHCFVVAAQISGIDGKVGNAPAFIILRIMGGKAFLDRILMAARKRREDQLAAIGVALMHGQFIAIFDCLDDFIDVRKVEAGRYPLRVHIERHGHETAVAGALTIAEQASLDPVSTCHQSELRCRDASAAVIVSVETDHSAFAIGKIAAEILDLIGVDIGRRCLDRGRQVEDNGMIGRRCEHFHHRFANLDRKIDFGS